MRNVFPACAGMSLALKLIAPAAARFPRMRGDEPFLSDGDRANPTFSPHARG